jgi:hypothetical protein
VTRSPKLWQAHLADIEFELYPRPVRMTLPIEWEAFLALDGAAYRRDFWPGQPAGMETGWDSRWEYGDIRMHLWSLLDDLSDRHGGIHSGRVDIAISPTAGVSPTAYYYNSSRKRDDIMIEGDYFRTPPNLIAEALMAASRELDRGERKELYRRSNVPHLWLLEPERETVEVYELRDDYELLGMYGPGQSFSTPLFPGEQIEVDNLFDTQLKRREKSVAAEKVEENEPDPVPEWLVPRETKIGLEYFFLLGHPQRRWEFWNNKSRSMLAFGSSLEARNRLQHFAYEAGCWEGVPDVRISELSPDVDQAEVGRFQLTRRGRVIQLHTAIKGQLYQELLATWARRESWDWGEE